MEVVYSYIHFTADFIAKKKKAVSQPHTSSRKGPRPLSRIVETRENSANKSRPVTRGIPKKEVRNSALLNLDCNLIIYSITIELEFVKVITQ